MGDFVGGSRSIANRLAMLSASLALAAYTATLKSEDPSRTSVETFNTRLWGGREEDSGGWPL